MSSIYSIDPSLYNEASLLGDAAAAASQAAAPMHAPDLNDLVAPQQSDVDSILRKKRKAREHKACYPCRQRKVKCDLSRPCQTCRDREHPELCDYNPPNKRPALEHPSIRGDDSTNPRAGSVTIARSDFEMLVERLSSLEESLSELRSELGTQAVRTLDPALAKHFGPASQKPNRSHIDVHGLHQLDDTGTTMHFAAGSIPAMLHALKSPNDDATQQELREQLNRSIMPLFGLDGGSATYPFVDLWGMPHGSLARVHELAKVLPDDQTMLALVRSYKSCVHVTFPGLSNLVAFEQDLTTFLIDRAAQQGVYGAVNEQDVHGKTLHWLGLLFAVAASGVQCSTMPRKQRELTSQVYVCCAAECLRITNFLARSNPDTIQTLVILQNVLSNNMNAGTAWAMLGITIRLAQGQGFHQPCGPHTTKERMLFRSRIWWSIIWQDSQLSLVYDRAGSDTLTCAGTMPMPTHVGDVSSFDGSMYRLADVTHRIIRARICSPDAAGSLLASKLERFHSQIVLILQEAAPHLQDARQCQSTKDSLEYWELFLHSSFVLAELCRPALDPARDVAAHRPLAIKSLSNTLEAWLGMQVISPFAKQSWSAIHRALSSALLLSILGEHNTNELTRKLLGRFVATISKFTAGIDPAEVSAPLQRGIDALTKLNLTDTVLLGALQTPNARPRDQTTIAAGADVMPPHEVLNDILWGAEGVNHPNTGTW